MLAETVYFDETIKIRIKICAIKVFGTLGNNIGGSPLE